MSSPINEVIEKLISDKSSAETLRRLLFSTIKEKDDIPEEEKEAEKLSNSLSQNPAVAALQKKEELLEALKPLFGKSFSEKADEVIKALQIAEIIINLADGKKSQ